MVCIATCRATDDIDERDRCAVGALTYVDYRDDTKGVRISRHDETGEVHATGGDGSEPVAIVREGPRRGAGPRGRGSWRTVAAVVVAFALGLSAGVVVAGSQTAEASDLAAMCTTLEGFDDDFLDRIGQVGIEDPNWARLKALGASAEAAGQVDESLQDLAEAGGRIEFARLSAEWDVVEEQLEVMREHC